MTMTTDEILARCTLRIRGRHVNVDVSNTVRVYDNVVGHYSIHHDLTEREIAIARKAAAANALFEDEENDEPPKENPDDDLAYAAEDVHRGRF